MRSEGRQGGLRTQARTETSRRRVGRLALVAVVAVLALMTVPALASAASSPAPTPVNSSPPALTGTPTLGQTLTCSPGTWANNPSGFAFAWLRDGAPIAGQTASTYVVQAADRGHSLSCQVTATNAGGEYTIVGLASGSYKVSFAAPFEGALNYLPQYYNGQSSSSSATPVSVTAPNTTPNVNASMQAGGEIAGNVTDASTHAALAGIRVCASSVTPGVGSGGCALTNPAGEYAIVGLLTASYQVTFYGVSVGGNYQTQYYNGKSSFGEAAAVAVSAGTTTPGIDAQMQPGGQISGIVTDASTHGAISKIEVCANSVTAGVYSGGCASTDSAGAYTISGLANASYDVRFSSAGEGFFGMSAGNNYLTQYYNGQSSSSTATPVPVTAANPASNINAEMLPGAQIAGKVTDTSAHPIAGVLVCAIGGSEEIGGCAITAAGGEYTISSLADGSYDVIFIPGLESEFGAPAGNYLLQYYNGKEPPQAPEAVSVTAPNKTSNINAELRAGGQIAGTVTDATTHAPLANVSVCPNNTSGGGGFGGCVSTNANGEYTASGLVSGTYNVEFFAPEGANYTPHTDTNIAVTAGAKTSSVDAAMSAGGQISGRVTSASGGAGIAGIEVCASETGSGHFGGCATTNGPGGSASAASNALSVPAPNSTFKLVKKPVFDPKKGTLDFFFNVANAGTFQWSLFFRNSDVGFADSLGISLGEGEAVAESAKKKGKKGARCKAGFIKHKHKCVRVKVPFGSGSQTVPAGTVKIEVHASAKAIKALKQGRALHVSGPFTFQSALGGTPVVHNESVTVRLPKKKGKHHKK